MKPPVIPLLPIAAGVARELNDLAVVVNANLHYLSEVEGEDLTEDGRQALRDSIRSMQRIRSIAQQVLDAGRLAASAEEVGSAASRHVARANVELFPARAPEPSLASAPAIAIGHEALAQAKGRPRLFLVKDESERTGLLSPPSSPPPGDPG